MLVLDANILVRAILGRRVRPIVGSLRGPGPSLLLPDAAYAEAEKYLPALLKKRGNRTRTSRLPWRTSNCWSSPSTGMPTNISKQRQESVCAGATKTIGRFSQPPSAFHAQSGQRTPIFFGTGVAQWTSDRVEIFLRNQANIVEQDER